jgi:hypothetical protein
LRRLEFETAISALEKGRDMTTRKSHSHVYTPALTHEFEVAIANGRYDWYAAAADEEREVSELRFDICLAVD